MFVRSIVGCLCLAAFSAQAGDFAVGKFVIDVPTKFAGPVSAAPDAQTKTYAFTAPSVGPTPNAVLQITAVDPGPASNQHGESAEISHRYLLQMLQGIERRRTDYRRSEPKSIRLADAPAAEVTWNGKANDIETNGRMFCIVSESGLLFFHVRGGGSSPNTDMAEAIKAVEQLRRTSTKKQ